MGTRAALQAYLDQQDGHVGGEKYWQYAYGWSGGGLPFCAVGVTCSLMAADVECAYFPSKVAFDKTDLWRIGDDWRDRWNLEWLDPIAFDWDKDGSGDHVGFFMAYLGDGKCRTFEYNVSNSVGYRIRDVERIIGGIRPHFDEDEPRIFTDVDKNTAHVEDIEWMKEQGIATGYDDGSYRPSKALTRGDCAAFLRRMDGGALFTDVDSYTPHLADIAWLAVRGISTGYADGTFRPSNSVARADLAAFLYRMAGSPDFADSSTFTDVGGIAHERAVRWLGTVGIAKGYADGTFRPYRAVTRADAAAMLHRAATL